MKRAGAGAQAQQRARTRASSVADPAAGVAPVPPAGGASTAVPTPVGDGGTAARRGLRWPDVRVVLCLLLGAALLVGIALAYVASRPDRYTSEALVAVLPDDGAGEVSEPLTSIWVEIGNSDVVLDRVTEGLGTSRSVLGEALTVTSSSDAPLISIRARTGDPDRSADWANAAAEGLLVEDEADRVPGWSLEQVTTARPAQTADPASTPLLVAAAALFGALGGAAVAQLLSARARRRRTAAGSGQPA